MLGELKGPPRVVACVLKKDQRTEMLQFVDQSWGIRKNGALLILWEPHEKQDCIQFFLQLTRLDQEEEVFMVMPGTEGAAGLTVHAAPAYGVN